jgi:hypothetical protein
MNLPEWLGLPDAEVETKSQQERLRIGGQEPFVCADAKYVSVGRPRGRHGQRRECGVLQRIN